MDKDSISEFIEDRYYDLAVDWVNSDPEIEEKFSEFCQVYYSPDEIKTQYAEWFQDEWFDNFERWLIVEKMERDFYSFCEGEATDYDAMKRDEAMDSMRDNYNEQKGGV